MKRPKHLLVSLVMGLVLLLTIAGVLNWTFGRTHVPPKPARLPAEVKAKLAALEPPRPVPPPTLRPVLRTEPLKKKDPADSSEEVRPASIAGRVIDKITRTPVAGAQVEVAVGTNLDRGGEPKACYSALTATDGSYRVAEITVEGNVRLSASADGYASARTGKKASFFGLPALRSIRSGETREGVNFALMPASCQLTGRVVNEAHTPLPGASVVVARQSGDNGSQGIYSDDADDNGDFQIALPSNDSCVLRAHKTGYEVGYFAEIVPGGSSTELVLRKGASIIGRITDAAGAPIANLDVQVLGEKAPGVVGNEWQSPGEFSTATDMNGDYRVEDLPQSFTYTVVVPHPQGQKPPWQDKARGVDEFAGIMQGVAFSVQETRLNLGQGEGISSKSKVKVRAGQSTRVDFVIPPDALQTISIHGLVTDPSTGAPVFPVFVIAESDVGQGPVAVATTATDSDGRYRLEIFGFRKPVTVAVKADYQQFPAPISSLAQANSAIATIEMAPGDEEEVNFTMPSPVVVPVIALSADGTPLEGIRLNGSILTDDEGRATLYGLAPYVSHVVFGQRKTEPTPRGTWIICGQSAPFSVAPGTTLPQVEVLCIAATGTAVGHIVSPEGMGAVPAGDVYCSIFQTNLPEQNRNVPVAADGTVVIEYAPEGTCTFLFQVITNDPAQRWWALVENVNVVPDATTDMGSIVPQPPAE